jgi:RNA polymerase sigma-70 factor (family 1)
MENIYALKEGCVDTFKMIYNTYHVKVYAFLLHKTGSTYIAEEVTQLTFIKFWEKRHLLSDEYAIDIQLFRIARTTMIDELRRDAVRNNHINELERTVSTAAVNADRIEEKDTLKHVNEAIELLPPMRKMVFKLSRINHLTNAEIAEMLALSQKTVENHISLAIKQLRRSAVSTTFIILTDIMLNNC